MTEELPEESLDGDGTEAAAPSDAAREALARARAAAAAAPPPARSTRRRTSYPAPQVRSGAGADGRDPQLLGLTVSSLLRERGWTESAAVGSLTGRWAEIVGVDVAEHVRPETFEQAPVAAKVTAPVPLPPAEPTVKVAPNSCAGTGTPVTVRVAWLVRAAATVAAAEVALL